MVDASGCYSTKRFVYFPAVHAKRSEFASTLEACIPPGDRGGGASGAPDDAWTFSMSWQQLAERSHWA